MKNNYVVSGILVATLILISTISCSSNGNSDTTRQNVKLEYTPSDSVALPIAYVNIDSLLLKYNFAIDMREQINSLQENVRASLNERERKVQAAAQEFQRKLENNAFLSQQRAQDEENRIQKMYRDFQEYAQQKNNDLELDVLSYHSQMTDSVNAALKAYNETMNFEVIFNNNASDNILLAHPKYDITDEIVTLMNKRCALETAASSGKK